MTARFWVLAGVGTGKKRLPRPLRLALSSPALHLASSAPWHSSTRWREKPDRTLPIRLKHTPTSSSDLISVAEARSRFAEIMGTLFFNQATQEWKHRRLS
jgi:hypothetical protein